MRGRIEGRRDWTHWEEEDVRMGKEERSVEGVGKREKGKMKNLVVEKQMALKLEVVSVEVPKAIAWQRGKAIGA